MKKATISIIALLLCALLTVFCFTACGSYGNGSDTTAADKNTANSSEVTIKETVLVDEQGVKAVAKSFGKYQGEFETMDNALVLEVTNNTEKTIGIGLNQASVNGYMFPTYFTFNIDAGKTRLIPAPFDKADIEKYGITTFADFEFRVMVTDAETSDTIIETEPISIKTSAADTYDYKYDESGKVFYDANGIKIIAKDIFEDENMGQCVNMYVSNQTDKNISVTVAKGSVNGISDNISYGSDVLAGKHSIDILALSDKNLVNKIESLTLSFSVFDSDSGEPIIEATDEMTVTF